MPRYRARHRGHIRAAGALLASLATLVGCGARTEPAARAVRSPVQDSASIAADRPERLVMTFAPPARGQVVVERVAPARAALEVAPPSAEPSEPPASEPAQAPADDDAQLKPPIARGAPVVPRGGGGGRVTFDVRVSEEGEVTDVELVEANADSLTVEAAKRAAWDLRYHPAMLRGERVAVWCRQVFDVQRQR